MVTGRRLSLRKILRSGVGSLLQDAVPPMPVQDGVTDIGEDNGLVPPEASKTAWQKEVAQLNVSSRHNGTVEDLPHVDKQVNVPVTAENQTEAETTGDGKQPGFNFYLPQPDTPKCTTVCLGEDEYCPGEGLNCQRLPLYYHVPKKSCYPDPAFPQMELERKQACRTKEMKGNQTTCLGNKDCAWREDAPAWFKRIYERRMGGREQAEDDRMRRKSELHKIMGAKGNTMQDEVAGHLAGAANTVLEPMGVPTVPPTPTTPAPLANETAPQAPVGVNVTETAPPPTTPPTNVTKVVMVPMEDVPVADANNTNAGEQMGPREAVDEATGMAGKGPPPESPPFMAGGGGPLPPGALAMMRRRMMM